MKKEVVLPDRLGGEKQITFVPVHFVQKTKRLCAEEEEEEEEDNDDKEEDGGQMETRCEALHRAAVLRTTLTGNKQTISPYSNTP